MAISVNMHVQGDEKIETRTTVHENEVNGQFAAVHVRAGDSEVVLFLNDVSDVDRLAFEFETLARSLREDHGWTPKH